MDKNDRINAGVRFFIVFAAIVAFVIGLFFGVKKTFQQGIDTIQKTQQIFEERKQEKLDELEACVNNGYVVYLDGSVIDSNTIDFSMYKTSISHENKAIYMTGN